ncbi:hypothetical protein QQ045_002585 [Rhodiola kirilowii]
MCYRFLRRRYNFLLKFPAQSHQPKQDSALPQKLKAQSKNKARPPVPKFETSQKGRVGKKWETTPLNQKPSLSIDLNQNIPNHNMHESTSRNPVHQLDLNQIAVNPITHSSKLPYFYSSSLTIANLSFCVASTE